MATDYSKNNIPLLGPQGKVNSNLASGGGGGNDMSGTVFGSSRPIAGANKTPTPTVGAASQDFVGNSVPLEGPTDLLGDDWLQLARDNFQVGRTYFDMSTRKRVEDNLAHAFSRHASGSKYYDPAYDKRSKYFRPKTRAMMRKQEAACAIAFFSTMDVVNCQPQDNDNKDQVLAASIHTELLNYRLRKTIPWFKFLLGGHFDAMTQGVVISCQEWRYKEASVVEDEMDGSQNPTGNTRQTTKVINDTPWPRLVPIENLILHPSCDWLDPINSSPYLIEIIPYYCNELAERIKNARSYGSQVPYIRDFSESELMRGGSEQDSSSSNIRMQRDNARVDRFSQTQQGQKFRPVWVHRNIVRIGGLDYVYETLGSTMLLSLPVPIEDVFGLARRPYVMGQVTVESHRPYPAGPVEMVRPTQEVMNELQNQREDNIKLALNSRYLAKRGSQVDMRSLMRNTPGSITLVTDPTQDVKQLETKDVTSSAYMEQDRLNLDFDDMSGQFTQSTVGAARNLNERVKGMELMGQGADMVTELSLRTLSETWVTPVLCQLKELEAAFETDQVVLGIVGSRTQTGAWHNAFKLLGQPVDVTVSVGFGNTDPAQRIQRLTAAWQTITQVAPTLSQGSDEAEFAREVMGALGYQDGARFYPGLRMGAKEDPKVTQLQTQVQQLQQQLQAQAAKTQHTVDIAKIRAASAEKIAQIKTQSMENIAMGRQAAMHYVAELSGQVKQLDRQISQEKNVIAQGNLLLEREALSNAIMQADREFALKVATTPGVPTVQQPQVEVPQVPGGGDQPFIQELRQPSSASAMVTGATDGMQPKLPGNDAAGVIQRGRFGMIPGKAG